MDVLTGTSHQLYRGKNHIGRATDNNIPASSEHASRYYAVLDVSLHSVQVQDLFSTSGTLIKGQKVDEAVLQAGDVLTIADRQFVLVRADGPDEPGLVDETTRPLSPGGRVDPRTSPAAVGTVVISRGKDQGRAFPVGPQGAIIGTSTKASIRLTDDSVDRIHARLRVDNGSLLVADRGSESGTKLAGRRLRPGEELEWHPQHTLGIGRSVSLQWFPAPLSGR